MLQPEKKVGDSKDKRYTTGKTVVNVMIPRQKATKRLKFN